MQSNTKTKSFAARYLLAAVLAIGLSPTALAQSAVLLPMPIPCWSFAGAPVAGGSVGFYASGTFNQLAVYADAGAVTQLSNPITLDSNGCPENGSGAPTSIFLQPGVAYRVQVENAASVQLYLSDGITGLASSQAQASTAVTFSATPTFTAAGLNQLFKMTLTGNVTSSTFNVASGISAPVLVTFELTEDGSGGRSFVWPPNSQGGSNINLAANAVTIEHFIWDGTTLYPLGGGRSPLSSGVGSPNSNVYSVNLQQANSANNVSLLNFQGPSTAVTGTGSAVNLYTYNIPGNTLSSGKILKITVCTAHTTGTASVTYLMKIGSATLQSIASATTGVGCIVELVGSTGSSAQTGIQTSATGAFSANAAASPSTPNVDQTVSQSILFSFNVANTDAVTPEFFSVELIQ